MIKDSHVMMAGEHRFFERVEYQQYRTRWIIGIDEIQRLQRILADRLLTDTKPLTLSEVRFFVASFRLNPDQVCEFYRQNQDPTAEESVALRAFFCSKI